MARYFDYIKINRPEYYSGRSDRMLSRIADELDSLICGNENEWTKYCLAGIHKSILTDALVEFAEDVYNDIGIWNAYENYNREFFGTPLPMTLSPGSEIEFRTITPERVAHLVWVFISELFYCPAIFPDDPQLFTMSGRISNFLNERFEKLPRDSGVKQFLSIPVRNYHEIKKRLMWLGTQSYFFRLPYENFRNDLNVKNEIEVADDFICAETTPWSGLGVIDILASLLNISSSQNKELRSWYERHLAIYRMENKGKDFVHALNLINNVSYRVKMDVKIKGFNPGETVIGSLVPWNGEWYWSGIQRSIKSITENKIRAIRNEFIRTNPQIVFRYEKNMANIAIESDRKQRERFISHFGDSLVVFPNGKSFRKEIENFYIDYIESIKKEMGKESEPKKKGLFHIAPRLLRRKSGIGVYFDAQDGIEIMTTFKDIENGFKKKGVGLSLPEKKGIRNFFKSDIISPAFIRKMVEKYGGESVSDAFGMNDPDHPVLEYLLRRYKGRFYRNVYPSVGLTNLEG